MTAAEVTRALIGFEQRLRDLGAPVTNRLRPGLDPEEIEQISAEHGVQLSQDATAWWAWHDGDRVRYEDDWGTPGLTPFTVFCGLRASLQRAAQLHDLTWDADAFDVPGIDADYLATMFDRQYVVLLQSQQPVVMDCRDPLAPGSPTGVYSLEGGIGRTITLTERVGWWHWALDTGFWILHPDGRWDVDLDRAPGQVVGLHARDHAS
ncbi:hypothetical protein KQI48_01060 [Cellulomonas hominis]|uniref:hypothetical protein n=1 Tax=Cellulomonas hominis TaxID=156981 RepID=UPI001C0FA235|nr:hypothetical protein [Cellulomonas hominis]MBU5421245.1 hypothetical protein [Cellulomonas hominis]